MCFQVLQQFQDTAFRSELHKFGLIGFDRIGAYKQASKRIVGQSVSSCRLRDAVVRYAFQASKTAFARRHVYKAVIVNLDVIGCANYRENVHVWEVRRPAPVELCCCVVFACRRTWISTFGLAA